MVSPRVLLSTLVLLQTATLPALGTVTRTSLFGYRLDPAGEVLELEEAAARLEALSAAPKRRPGLVRLGAAEASAIPPALSMVPPVTVVTSLPEVPAVPAVTVDTSVTVVPMVTTPPGPARVVEEVVHRLEIAVDRVAEPPVPALVEEVVVPLLRPPPEGEKREPMVTYGHSPVTLERVVELDDDEARFSNGELDDEPPPSTPRFVGSDVDLEPEPDLLVSLVGDELVADRTATARVCGACNGGRRRGACARCDGRCVRAWVANREVSPVARPRCEEESLGVVYALSDLFPSLDDRQRQGALALLGGVTRGASPQLRRQASAQWALGAAVARADAARAGALPAEQRAVEARWQLPTAPVR